MKWRREKKLVPISASIGCHSADQATELAAKLKPHFPSTTIVENGMRVVLNELWPSHAAELLKVQLLKMVGEESQYD